MGCRQIGSLQGLRSSHAPFGVVLELIRLLAVGDCSRSGSTSEDNGDSCRESPFEGLLRQANAAVLAAGIAKIVLLLRDKIIQRDDKRKLLLKEDLHPSIVEFQEMIGSIDSGF